MSWQDAENFSEALRQSHLPSVDRFLELNPEYAEVGKFCIAMCLIPYENPNNLMNRGEATSPHGEDYRWYEYLFEVLTEGLQEPQGFRQNNLSIITFNYDRSLDYFLTASLKYAFGIRTEVAENIRSDGVPIVHVHGKLGSLFGGLAPRRGYTKDPHPHSVGEAAKSIELVHENSERDRFDEAIELLDDAELICFLGNGYHRRNLEKLELDFVFGEKSSQMPKVKGTGVGLTESEREEVNEMFGEWAPYDNGMYSLFPRQGATNLELLRKDVRLE